MATRTKRNLTIFSGLAIVTVEGFEPERDTAVDEATGVEYVVPEIDPHGSANWLVQTYGIADSPSEGEGILWVDYDLPDERFSVLVDSDDVEDFSAFAAETGYTIVKSEEVTEPAHYGDSGSGTVAIMRHPDGWVVLE